LPIATIAGGEPDSLIPQLEPLRPFLGKTWRGEFRNSTPANPMIDVSRWERALNGTAVRVLHSMNDGSYGGETLLTWDKEKETLVFHYFTTAGFQTTGTMKVTEGRFTSHEVVKGDAKGVTEVKATGEVRPDGTMIAKSEYLRDGKWVPGHEITYREDPAARVLFR
jgi:hypothetical protein